MNLIIHNVADILQRIPAIRAAYLVGSYADGETGHDVDILLLVSVQNKKELIEALERDYYLDVLLVNDDSVSCVIENVPFDFAFLTIDEWRRRLGRFRQKQTYAEIRNWCVGYWLPEGFLFDMMKALCLFCKDTVIQEGVQSIAALYQDYRLELIQDIKTEVILKSKLRDDLPFYSKIARGDVLAALLRLINLSNDWRLTSFKHMDQKVRTTAYDTALRNLEQLPSEEFSDCCKALAEELTAEL